MKQITRKISSMSLKGAAARGMSTAAEASASKPPSTSETKKPKTPEDIYRDNQSTYPLCRPEVDKVDLGVVGQIKVGFLIDAISVRDWKRLVQPGLDNAKKHFDRIQYEMPRKIQFLAASLPPGVSIEGAAIADLEHLSKDRIKHFSLLLFKHPEIFRDEHLVAEIHIAVDPELQAESDKSLPSAKQLLWRLFDPKLRDSKEH